MTLRGFIGGRLSNLEMVSLSIASYMPIHRVRKLMLTLWGARVHKDAIIYHGFQVRNAKHLRIGARSSIGDGAILDARGGLKIGADVNLSTGVNIWTAQHDWNDPEFSYTSAPVEIGDRAWLSTRVTVLPGVRIGEGAVVAAGSVVTKNLEPFALYGGTPAKKIRDRNTSLTYSLVKPRFKAWWW